MNFKIGDKVKFLNENDYGTVVRVLNNQTVIVLNSDDFEIPVNMSELILENDNQVSNKNKKEEKTFQPIKTNIEERNIVYQKPNFSSFDKPKSRNSESYGFYLGFLPENDKNPLQENLEMYLINDSDYKILYNILSTSKQKENLFVAESGILEDNTKAYIKTIKREDLNDISGFKFQFLFSKEEPFEIKKPEEYSLKISPQKFFIASYYKVNDFFDENAVIFTIQENSAIQNKIKELSKEEIIKEKEQKTKQKVFKKPPEKEVVDLHLVELLDDDRGMTPKEKLDYQIKVFREKLEEYIKDPYVKKVVFIHGKGNGTLKSEVRRCLDLHYKRYQYQDASFEEYGGGATLVYVK